MTDSIQRQHAHYTGRFPFECIELTRHLTFLAGNSAKYVYRHCDKGTLLADMGKAVHYWEWVILHGDPIILPEPQHHEAVMAIYWEHLHHRIHTDITARILGHIIWRDVHAAEVELRNCHRAIEIGMEDMPR